MARIAPWDSSGHSANATFDAAHISSQATDRVFGRPWPPNSGLLAMPGQPPSQNLRVGVGEFRRHLDAVPDHLDALPVTDHVGRGQHTAGEFRGFLEHGLDDVAVHRREIAQRAHLVEVRQVLERESSSA